MNNRGRGFWWLLAAIMVALALGFCAWLARDLYLKPRQLDPGEVYTDPLGVSYTVLAREIVDELPDGSDDVIHPVPGAVFLRYTIAVDNYVFEEGSDIATVCTFELVSTSGEIWDDEWIHDPVRDHVCRTDPDEITASQQVTASFQVPESMLDQVVGLVSDSVPGSQFPIISEPR